MSETIRIVGTGPVSLALRGFLGREGFTRNEMICDAPRRELPAALGRRALALSLGSWQLLGRFAPLPVAAPILAVEVSMRAYAGHTRLSAAELALPALGYVVPYEHLHRALCAALPEAIEPAGAPGTSPSAAPRSATSPSATSSPAPAVTVVADGDPGDAGRQRDFDQAALLTTVRALRPVEGVAFERFTFEGPLALLPLSEGDRWSVVWCASPDAGRRRMALPDAALEAELVEAFGPRLGLLQICGERHLAPLQRRLRSTVVRGAHVAIGNAAQSLHPVAGQGLNLGLRDAFVLARHLGDARARRLPLAAALPAFVRARRADRFALVTATDALATLFTVSPLRPLESLALGLLELTPPARRLLSRVFMFGLRG